MDVKKLMLMSVVCCVVIQQASARVNFDTEATQTLQKAIETHERQKNSIHKKTMNRFYYQDDKSMDEAIREAFISMVTKYEDYNAYKLLKKDNYKMIGVGAFIPFKETSVFASDDEVVLKKIKVYFAGNFPVKNDSDASKLVKLSDYTHTERQLAICALYNAANLKNKNEVVDLQEIKLPILKTKRSKMKKIRGELHIYMPAPPCSFSNNINYSGGKYCTQYYADLTNLYPNLKIHVYFNKQFVTNISSMSLDGCSYSELFQIHNNIFSREQIENLQNKIKDLHISGLATLNKEWINHRLVHLSDIKVNAPLHVQAAQQLRSTVTAWLLDIVKGDILKDECDEYCIKSKLLGNLFRCIIRRQNINKTYENIYNLQFHALENTD